MHAPRSSTSLLAGIYLLLLVYASLYPFEGWRWPAGAAPTELALLSWPRWRDPFDEWANFLGYAPFGALLFLAMRGRRWSPIVALVCSTAAAAALSYGLEVLQHLVPGRFPSLRDWVHNSFGAAMGAVLGWLVHASGALELLRRTTARWLAEPSASGTVLLLLWPLGLLFPAPVPMGLGQIGPELLAALDALLDGTPAQAWVGPDGSAASQPHAPLSTLRESCALFCGLGAPCLLAGVLTRPGWPRLLVAPALAVIAAAVLTFSTALNFGPQHAWAWMTPRVSQTLLVSALVLGAVLLLSSPRTCAALGLVCLTALVVIVAAAPADPYYAASLRAWEQGRFIRFSGLAYWVGLLWPYLAMLWLVVRLGRRDR